MLLACGAILAAPALWAAPPEETVYGAPSALGENEDIETLLGALAKLAQEQSLPAPGLDAALNRAAGDEAARLVRVLDGEHIHTAVPLGTLTGTWTEDGAERTEVLATIR